MGHEPHLTGPAQPDPAAKRIGDAHAGSGGAANRDRQVDLPEPLAGTPGISVICTSRNAASTIRFAVTSIMAQVFQDWEMIVVDDGSRDATLRIVRMLEDQDPRLRVIPTAGVGRGRALNMALARARAPWVANLDADDESHPLRLAIQHDLAVSHPEFPLVGTGTILVWGRDRPDWPVHVAEETTRAIRDVTDWLTVSNPINHSSVLMDRRTVLSIGGYREDLRSNFDYDLWVRLAAAGHRLGQVDVPLAAKRVHPAQCFEASWRVSYLYESARVQARAIRSLSGSKLCWFLLVARVAYGLLPKTVRLRYVGSARWPRRQAGPAR